MNVLISSLLSAIILAGTLSVSAEEVFLEDYIVRCETYAQEGNIPPEEFDSYVRECLEKFGIDPEAEEPLEVDEPVLEETSLQ